LTVYIIFYIKITFLRRTGASFLGLFSELESTIITPPRRFIRTANPRSRVYSGPSPCDSPIEGRSVVGISVPKPGNSFYLTRCNSSVFLHELLQFGF
jgi:hypothetical protein